MPAARFLAALAAALTTLTLAACSAGRSSRAPDVPLADVARERPVMLAKHESDAVSLQGDTEDPEKIDPRRRYVTPERLQHGYTIIVVGANGDHQLNNGLTPGIIAGGYPGAVESVDWTTGVLPLVLYHLRACKLHRAGAEGIVEKIVDYQRRYPSREVNLVGYSAGAVVALEAVKLLPEENQIARTVLVAGAVSPIYDLRPVLERSRVGVWNLFQPQDVPLLWAGTLLAGTSDGYHMMSAGAVAFWYPLGADRETRQLYRDKLVQVRYRPQMALAGNLGGHFQCVNPTFVAQWIAPALLEGAQHRYRSIATDVRLARATDED